MLQIYIEHLSVENSVITTFPQKEDVVHGKIHFFPVLIFHSLNKTIIFAIPKGKVASVGPPNLK
jgi:hypothetical protein